MHSSTTREYFYNTTTLSDPHFTYTLFYLSEVISYHTGTYYYFSEFFSFNFQFIIITYCLTKISIRAKRSISRVFSSFIVPSPFFVHCPYKGRVNQAYLLTNWLAYLYERIQSPRPDVMPDRREGITRAAGFVFACIDTQAS